MGQTVDIGKRIELVPMDPHFHDITIALYQQGQDESPLFLVYTYSQMEGVQGRIQFVVRGDDALGKHGYGSEPAAPVSLRISTPTRLQAQLFWSRVSSLRTI